MPNIWQYQHKNSQNYVLCLFKVDLKCISIHCMVLKISTNNTDYKAHQILVIALSLLI